MMDFLATGFGLFVCVALFFLGIVGWLFSLAGEEVFAIKAHTALLGLLLSAVCFFCGAIGASISIVLQIGLFFSHH